MATKRKAASTTRATKATKAKKAAPKKAAAKPKRAAKAAVADLSKLVEASVLAAAGKGGIGGGILAGFIATDGVIKELGKSPKALATAITSQLSKELGLKLKPGVIKGPGGSLVGFMPVLIRQER